MSSFTKKFFSTLKMSTTVVLMAFLSCYTCQALARQSCYSLLNNNSNFPLQSDNFPSRLLLDIKNFNDKSETTTDIIHVPKGFKRWTLEELLNSPDENIKFQSKDPKSLTQRSITFEKRMREKAYFPIESKKNTKKDRVKRKQKLKDVLNYWSQLKGNF